MPGHSHRRKLIGLPKASIHRPAFRLPERFYGDGDPQWVEGRTERPCQTAAQAEHVRRLDLRHLAKHADGHPSLDDLANRIASCKPRRRCYSGACALCLRANQRWFVARVQKLIDKLGLPLATLSLIPPIHIRGGHDHEHLKRQIRTVHKQITDALAEAGFTFVVGGIDISRNHHSHVAHQPFFQLHFYGFAPFDEALKAKAILKQHFPATTTTKRPVAMPSKPFDGRLGGIAYAMKSHFTRRSTTPASQLECGAQQRQNTRKGKPLTIAEDMMLFPILDILGFERRLILRRAVLKLNRKGFLTIRQAVELGSVCG